MPTKICSKCKNILPATAEYFYRDKNGKHGLTSICKVCKAEAFKIYYKRPEIKEQRKKYHRNWALMKLFMNFKRANVLSVDDIVVNLKWI